MPSTLSATPSSSGLIISGEYLCSPSGTCWLTMQDDGNLVLYLGERGNSDNHIWSTQRSYQRNGRYHCAIQSDGNLVVYYGAPEWSEKVPIWTSETARGQDFYFLRVEDNQRVALYVGVPSNPRGRLWSSN